MNLWFWHLGVGALYVGGTASALHGWIRPPGRPAATTAALATGWAVQTWLLLHQFLTVGVAAFTRPAEVFTFLSWALVLVYILALLKFRTEALALLVAPTASVFLLGRLFSRHPVLETPLVKEALLPIHTGFILLSYGALGLAAAGGLFYLFEERALKRRLGSVLLRKLPSLDELDQINIRAAFVGFLFLTVGLVSGTLWAQKQWAGAWRWDPKFVTASGAWLLYALLIAFRLATALRGRKIAALAVAGFVVLLFAFLGVDRLLPTLHSRF